MASNKVSLSIYEGCECLGANGVWRAVVSYRKRPDRVKGLAFGVDHCFVNESGCVGFAW